MIGSALSYGLMAAGIFDIGLGSLAYWNVEKFGQISPFWISADDKYTRMVGCFMMLCGIARFHGGSNITEKGAYRVAIWSFLAEIFFHAMEVQRGTFTLGETKHVFIICGVAVAIMTKNYSRCLYPEKSASKTK